MTKRKTPEPSPGELLAALSTKLAGAVTGDKEFYGQEKNVKNLLEMFNRLTKKIPHFRLTANITLY